MFDMLCASVYILPLLLWYRFDEKLWGLEGAQTLRPTLDTHTHTNVSLLYV